MACSDLRIETLKKQREVSSKLSGPVLSAAAKTSPLRLTRCRRHLKGLGLLRGFVELHWGYGVVFAAIAF